MRKPIRNRRRRKSKTSYESLESRKMLAGDVNVFVHQDMLFIRADHADNQIAVVGTENGLEVQGNGTTTINGTEGPVVFEGDFSAIRANLGRGNDSLFIENVDMDGRTVVYGGSGDDSIGVYQSSFDRGLMVQSGRGDDMVSIDEVNVGGNLIVVTGQGDDQIGVDASTIDGYTLFLTGNGDDDLALQNSTHNGSAYLLTGGGQDFIGADNLTVGQTAVIWTGWGSDDVYINDSDFNRVYAFGGFRANDNLEVDGDTNFTVDPFVRDFEGDDVAGGQLQAQQVYDNLVLDGARLGTIAELARLTPDLSTLNGALVATGLDSNLSGAGPFTVFAPLNSAFDQISDTVAGLTTEQLTNVLLFHVTSGDVSSGELVQQDSVDTLLGQSFSVDASGDEVLLNGNATLAATDIRAKNGTVHLLNQVLIPA